MSTENINSIRKFALEDLEVEFSLSGEIPEEHLTEQITEARIASFCKGCDILTKDGYHYAKDPIENNTQARYAARGWCGWAQVNGVRGEMTDLGFVPFKSNS